MNVMHIQIFVLNTRFMQFVVKSVHMHISTFYWTPVQAHGSSFYRHEKQTVYSLNSLYHSLHSHNYSLHSHDYSLHSDDYSLSSHDNSLDSHSHNYSLNSHD